MKYDPKKVGMNLAIEIENKENNMVLNYYYDAKSNYSLKQDGDEYVVSIDMPGIKKTDLSITISKEGNDNTLSIKAQNKDRDYSQNLKVSNKFDDSNVKASLSEGVLKIRMKLKEETSKKHKIEIE